MTAVAYAMSDSQGAVVSADYGGCGETHKPKADEAGRLYIECDQCAPWLAGNFYGYAATPDNVPLTPAEMREREYAEREAKSANAILANEAVKRLLSPQAAGADLESVLKGMSPEQLLGALSSQQKAAVAAAISGADDEPKPAAPKRRGRPPKAAAAE